MGIGRWVDHVGGRSYEKDVAVRGSANDGFGRYVGAGARPVLNDEWLAESLRQPWPQEARENIGCAARAEADDQVHRLRRVALRPCNARDSRQRGSARG